LAEPSEVPYLLEIQRRSAPFIDEEGEQWYRRLVQLNRRKQPGALVLIAKVENEVAGYVIAYSCASSTGYIDELAVHPAFRGRGVGSALLKSAEQELLKRGAKVVELSVKSGDVGALNFYLKRGYTVTNFTFNLKAEVSRLRVCVQASSFRRVCGGDSRLIGELKPLVWWNELTWQFDSKLNGEVGGKPLSIYDDDGIACYLEYSVDEGDLYVDYAAVRDVNDALAARELVGALRDESKKHGLKEIYISVDAEHDVIVSELLSFGFQVFEVEFRAQKNLLA